MYIAYIKNENIQQQKNVCRSSASSICENCAV